jgi:S-adenosyl methyltransferase
VNEPAPGGTPPPGLDVSAAHLAQTARTERAFLVRAVRFLAGPARIRQFLDIGAGLPAGGNTHEIAQRCAANRC